MRKRFFIILLVLMLLVSTAPIFAQDGPGTKNFAIRDFGACINLPDFTNMINPDPYNTIYQVPGLFSINFAEYLMPLAVTPSNNDEIYTAMISLLNTVSASDYQRIGFNHSEYISAAVEFTLDGRRMFGMIYRNQTGKLFFLFADKVAGFDMLAIGRAIFAADAKCNPLNLDPIVPQSSSNTSIIPGTGGSASAASAPAAAPVTGAAAINFGIVGDHSGLLLSPGTCVTIEWQVENVQAVYFEGQGVGGYGSSQVCPTSTQTYTLQVIKTDGSQETRQTTARVNETQSSPQNQSQSSSQPEYDVYLELNHQSGTVSVCPNETVILGWWSNGQPLPDSVQEHRVYWDAPGGNDYASIPNTHVPGSWQFIPSQVFPGAARVGFIVLPVEYDGTAFGEGSNFIWMDVATVCF